MIPVACPPPSPSIPRPPSLPPSTIFGSGVGCEGRRCAPPHTGLVVRDSDYRRIPECPGPISSSPSSSRFPPLAHPALDAGFAPAGIHRTLPESLSHKSDSECVSRLAERFCPPAPLRPAGAAARRFSRCTLAWRVALDTLPDAPGREDPVAGPPLLPHTLSRSPGPLPPPRFS